MVLLNISDDPLSVGLIVAAFTAGLAVLGFLIKWVFFPDKKTKIVKGVPQKHHDKVVKEVGKLEGKLEFTEQQLTEVRQDLALSEEKISEITSQLEKEREKSSIEDNLKTQLKEYDEQGEFEKAELLVEEELVNKNRIELADAYFQQAGYAFLQLKYEKAIKLYEEAIKLQPKNVTFLSDAGYIYRLLGRYEIAKNYYERSFHILSDEKNPLEKAMYYLNVADIETAMYNFTQAKELYYKALNIAIKIKGLNDDLVSSCYNGLGLVFYNLKEYRKAQEYYKTALKIEIELHSENSTGVAAIYNNIGNISQDVGDLDEAEKYYIKSLEIEINIEGENGPNVGGRYNNLGELYRYKGDFSKAELYYKKALEIDLLIYGESHPEIATIYNNIALINEHTGNYEASKQYYNKSLLVNRLFFGEDHPTTQITLKNISVLETKMSRQ
jgi:tetratricopeptide (TPR) repeat protein